MDLQPITLTGDTVRLEPLAARHAADLARAASPELFAYYTPPAEISTAGFEAQIAHQLARPARLYFAIVLRDTNQAIGVTAYLDIRAEHRGLEIGSTWIGKAHQGTRVNPECKWLMLYHAFEDQNAARVQLKTDARNLQSQRAIEKLGALREGTLRQHMVMNDGYIRDSVMYSIVRAEWPHVEARLRARLAHKP